MLSFYSTWTIRNPICIWGGVISISCLTSNSEMLSTRNLILLHLRMSTMLPTPDVYNNSFYTSKRLDFHVIKLKYDVMVDFPLFTGSRATRSILWDETRTKYLAKEDTSIIGNSVCMSFFIVLYYTL